jgi:hypothetical protein
MNKFRQGLLGAFALWLSANSAVFAIEGLQASIQQTNAVLWWPSDPSETYIIQYRHALNDSDGWTNLTDYYPADSGSNVTYFVDPNPADFGSWTNGSYGSGGGGGGGGLIPPGGGGSGSGNIIFAGTGFYRVVRDGVHFWNLTNDANLSGIVKLPVEAAYSQGALDSVTISANGNAIEGASAIIQPFSQPVFNFDTRRLNNGDYYLQAMGMWLWDTTNAYDSPYVQLYSPSILVHITNSISFPDWVQEFRDDLMLIKVTSVETNTDWQIDVYGEQGDYVGSFTNHTSDGTINISWNLRDSNGNLRGDSFFTTVTKILDPDTATNPPLVRVVDNYPDQGTWVIARADYIPSGYQNYGLYTNTQDGFAEMGESDGGVRPEAPYRSSGSSFFIDSFTNAYALNKVFTNSDVRNFYFDGHGGPDWLGIFPNTNGIKNLILSASQVAAKLNTVTVNTNSIRYRWVWIDSCNSALGIWPQTFGLGTRENVPLANYTSRPGAFCGFDSEVYAAGPGAVVNIDSINFRGYFLDFWWLYGDPLKDSFDEASLYSQCDDEQYLKVYGYWGLNWDELNTKGEWPPH